MCISHSGIDATAISVDFYPTRNMAPEAPFYEKKD